MVPVTVELAKGVVMAITGGVALDSYTSLLKQVKPGSAATSLFYTAITTGKMSKSPYPQFATADENIIRDWINSGALNN